MGLYNFKWERQSASICGLLSQNGVLVLQLKCLLACFIVALWCADIKITFFFPLRFSEEKYLKERSILKNFHPGFSLKKWATCYVGMNVSSQCGRFLFRNFKFWEKLLFQRHVGEKKGNPEWYFLQKYLKTIKTITWLMKDTVTPMSRSSGRAMYI